MEELGGSPQQEEKADSLQERRQFPVSGEISPKAARGSTLPEVTDGAGSDSSGVKDGDPSRPDAACHGGEH